MHNLPFNTFAGSFLQEHFCSCLKIRHTIVHISTLYCRYDQLKRIHQTVKIHIFIYFSYGNTQNPCVCFFPKIPPRPSGATQQSLADWYI